MNKRYRSIDEYIKSFPGDIQSKLNELRALIRQSAPEAQEKISYQMPTFFLNGNLVHFAAYARHIGFYPTPNGIESFKKELSKYRARKEPYNSPWPRLCQPN